MFEYLFVDWVLVYVIVAPGVISSFLKGDGLVCYPIPVPAIGYAYILGDGLTYKCA